MLSLIIICEGTHCADILKKQHQKDHEFKTSLSYPFVLEEIFFLKKIENALKFF